MGGNFRFTGIWDFSPEMVNGRPKMRYHVISGTRGTDMDRDEVSGYERCGEAYHPQAQPGPHAQSSTTETPSPTASRDPDAKFNELLAQAREIMQDPEFMEEVMALVRLLSLLRNEVGLALGDNMAMATAVAALVKRRPKAR